MQGQQADFGEVEMLSKKSNHKITWEVPSARVGWVVGRTLASSLVGLGSQGRGRGPLLGNKWEELPRSEAANAEGGLAVAPCVDGEEVVLLALACSRPWVDLVVHPQLLAEELHQGTLHNIEELGPPSSNCGTRTTRQPARKMVE